jgi:hypothetical protein
MVTIHHPEEIHNPTRINNGPEPIKIGSGPTDPSNQSGACPKEEMEQVGSSYNKLHRIFTGNWRISNRPIRPLSKRHTND